MWVDLSDPPEPIGAVRFLVEVTIGDRRQIGLCEHPLRDPWREPHLTGWCGTNGTARGLVRVTKINHAGDRAKVEALRGDELAAALEELGYPELVPDGTEGRVDA